MCSRALFTVIVFVSGSVAVAKELKVAVVGAGIGGAAFSHYLQRELKKAGLPPAKITVFERNGYIGGRIQEAPSVWKKGPDSELGAHYWAGHHVNMEALQQELNVSLSDYVEAVVNNILWNGSAFVDTPDLEMDPKVIEDAVGSMLQASSPLLPPFKSVAEYIGRADLSKYLSKSTPDFFRGYGVSDKVIDEVFVPALRQVYGTRGVKSNHPYGALDLFGTNAYYAAGDGNTAIMRAAFASAGAEVTLSTEVFSISIVGDGSGGRLFAVESYASGTTTTDVFDRVIVAAPLEITDIEYKDIELEPTAKVKYDYEKNQYTWAVKADGLNPAQFGGQQMPCDASACQVGTDTDGTTPSTPYYAIGGYKPDFTIFTVNDLPSNLSSLFSNPTASYGFKWNYTFGYQPPIIDPDRETQPIVLHPAGLYNMGALECISTSMEYSVISALNIARLIVQSVQTAQVVAATSQAGGCSTNATFLCSMQTVLPVLQTVGLLAIMLFALFGVNNMIRPAWKSRDSISAPLLSASL